MQSTISTVRAQDVGVQADTVIEVPAQTLDLSRKRSIKTSMHPKYVQIGWTYADVCG